VLICTKLAARVFAQLKMFNFKVLFVASSIVHQKFHDGKIIIKTGMELIKSSVFERGAVEDDDR
jgi:hypothetical protein